MQLAAPRSQLMRFTCTFQFTRFGLARKSQVELAAGRPIASHSLPGEKTSPAFGENQMRELLEQKFMSRLLGQSFLNDLHTTRKQLAGGLAARPAFYPTARQY